MSVSIKDANLNEVIEILRRYGPISVKEISKISKLSVPCVMKYVSDMTEKHVLTESVNEETAAGRKPKVYSINGNGRHIIGIDLGGGMIEIGIANLSGELLFHRSLKLNDSDDGAECIDCVISETREMIKDSGIPASSIDCMIIGNPGVVNSETGEMRLNASSASWYSLPVKKIFADAFQVEVQVYNDVNLSAIGEKVYGEGKGYDNFIYIRGDVGVKAGIVINGKLFEGEHHAAGEFGLNYLIGGHTDAVDFKKMRRIEDKVSMLSLLCAVRKKMVTVENDPVLTLTNHNPELLDLEILSKALDNPTTFVLTQVEECAQTLAVSVANLVLTLDISLIIFGGEITRLHNHILKPIRNRLNELLENPPTILLSELGNQSCMYGAISVGQELAYKNLLSTVPV